MKKRIILAIILPILILLICQSLIISTRGNLNILNTVNTINDVNAVDDVFIYEKSPDIFDSLDPAVDYESFGNEIIQQIYETLYTYDGSSTDLVPNLATSFVISTDGLQWNFTLRDDVTFHDGTPFNASCMKYALDRAIIMSDPDGPTWMISQVINGAPFYTFDIADPNVIEAEAWLAMDAIVADDINNKLTINLEIPYTPFLAALTYTIGSVISPSYVYTNRFTNTENGDPYTFIPGHNTPYDPATANNDTDQLDMGWWFPALEGTGSGIVPGHQNEWMNNHTCGTGPFYLSSLTPTDIFLERNDDWWFAGVNPTKLPAIRQVQYKTVVDTATRMQDLKDGLCEAAYIPAVNMSQIYDVQTKQVLVPNLKVTISPSFSVMYLAVCLNDSLSYNNGTHNYLDENPVTSTYDPIGDGLRKYGNLNPDLSLASPNNPFSALKFRKAIAHSFDYDEFINQSLNGFGERMIGAIPKGMFGHVDDLSLPEYDLTLAKTLFQEVGWQGTFVLGYNAGNDIRKAGCFLLKDRIENLQVGISVIVEEFLWIDYLNHIRHQHLAAFFQGWAPDYCDPDNYVDPFLNSAGTLAKRQVYKNDAVDNAINAAKTEQNPNIRASYYETVEDAAAGDIAHIYTYQASNYLVTQDYVRGIKGGFSTNPMYPRFGYRDLYEQTPTSPSVPLGLSATADYNGVNLSWTTPVDDGGYPVTEYRVYRGTTTGVYSYLGNTTVTDFNDTTGTIGTTYYYVVTAINTIGESGYSNEINATPTSSIFPPSPPQSLTATAGYDSVYLSWAAPADDGGSPVTEYRVYRGTQSGFYGEIGKTTSTTYNDTTVTGGTTYYYVVQAINIVGGSFHSNEVSVTPLEQDPTSESSITNVTPFPSALIVLGILSFFVVFKRKRR